MGSKPTGKFGSGQFPKKSPVSGTHQREQSNLLREGWQMKVAGPHRQSRKECRSQNRAAQEGLRRPQHRHQRELEERQPHCTTRERRKSWKSGKSIKRRPTFPFGFCPFRCFSFWIRWKACRRTGKGLELIARALQTSRRGELSDSFRVALFPRFFQIVFQLGRTQQASKSHSLT